MTQQQVLIALEQLKIYARQFEVGARVAAQMEGITVVIDVFRASNTMLELVDAGAEVHPVTTIDQTNHPSYKQFIKVGEDEGRQLADFAYDNSPVTINLNRHKFSNTQVLLRTTNGTRGIEAAVGSAEIIVGTFRNFSSVVDYCLQRHHQGQAINFVAMGTRELYRIEDAYCAKMFVIRMLERLDRQDVLEELETDNPWLRDWRDEIRKVRWDNPSVEQDYEFGLQLDTTTCLPRYDPQTGALIDISS